LQRICITRWKLSPAVRASCEYKCEQQWRNHRISDNAQWVGLLARYRGEEAANMRNEREDGALDLSLDFVAYLERRLALGRIATLRLLGEWLSQYEPEGGRAARPLDSWQGEVEAVPESSRSFLPKSERASATQSP
jgi:hypothetical protein